VGTVLFKRVCQNTKLIEVKKGGVGPTPEENDFLNFQVQEKPQENGGRQFFHLKRTMGPYRNGDKGPRKKGRQESRGLDLRGGKSPDETEAFPQKERNGLAPVSFGHAGRSLQGVAEQATVQRGNRRRKKKQQDFKDQFGMGA